MAHAFLHTSARTRSLILFAQMAQAQLAGAPTPRQDLPGRTLQILRGGRTTSRIAATHSSYNDMMCSRTSAVNIWKKAAFALWFVTVPKQSWHLFGRQKRMHLLWSLECPKTQWQNPLPNRHETPVVFRV